MLFCAKPDRSVIRRNHIHDLYLPLIGRSFWGESLGVRETGFKTLTAARRAAIPMEKREDEMRGKGREKKHRLRHNFYAPAVASKAQTYGAEQDEEEEEGDAMGAGGETRGTGPRKGHVCHQVRGKPCHFCLLLCDRRVSFHLPPPALFSTPKHCRRLRRMMGLSHRARYRCRAFVNAPCVVSCVFPYESPVPRVTPQARRSGESPSRS